MLYTRIHHLTTPSLSMFAVKYSISTSAVFVYVTYIFIASFAFLSSFPALCVCHFSTETGNIVVALFGVPLLSALLASEAKLLVLILSLCVGAVGSSVRVKRFGENATNTHKKKKKKDLKNSKLET